MPDNNKPKKITTYIWMAAGLLFFLAAGGEKQPAFYGIGVMFLLFAVSNFIKSR